MRYTHEDNLTRLWMPAVRTIRPGSELMHERAALHAITQDGHINPDAILPGSTVLVDFDSASNTSSSTDTVNYAEYLSTVITLPEGTWTLKARGALTGWPTATTNFNSIVVLNGEQSSNFQIPLSTGDMGTVFPRMWLEQVAGEVTLQVMFRPSASQMNIEAGEWLYRAERIR